MTKRDESCRRSLNRGMEDKRQGRTIRKLVDVSDKIVFVNGDFANRVEEFQNSLADDDPIHLHLTDILDSFHRMAVLQGYLWKGLRAARDGLPIPAPDALEALRLAQAAELERAALAEPM